MSDWSRLHPLSPFVRAGALVKALVIVVFTTFLLRGDSDPWGLTGHAIAPVAIVALGAVSWLVTRWRVESGDLRIETGLVRRESLRFPLRQVQAIDVVRPLLARVFGLAELRLRMGGTTSDEGRLAYLPLRDAERLRTTLLALAQGEPAEDREPAEDVLLSVPVGRLVASIALSGAGLAAAALAVALVVGVALSAHTAWAVVVAVIAPLIGFGEALWRRFNGEYRMTVAEAPDGLRLRSGLAATSAETILRGRVQAVRMTEPLLWRPFGWCRLEVAVAGKQRRKRENAPEGKALRAVLPVGSRAQADELLRRIVPGAPLPCDRAPRRARWKSPLRFRNLAWGRTDACVVASSGRLARRTTWVPLAKVQSLRHVQGPVERRLRLATVHLDTAGHSVHAALRDRDQTEARDVLWELTDLCRANRRAASAARPRPGSERPLSVPS